MKAALHKLRAMFDHDIHIMAGNIATLEALNDLSDWALALCGATLVEAPSVQHEFKQATASLVYKQF